jgi:hypothetical protein
MTVTRPASFPEIYSSNKVSLCSNIKCQLTSTLKPCHKIEPKTVLQ